MNVPGLRFGNAVRQNRYIGHKLASYLRGDPKYYRLLVKTGAIRVARAFRPQSSGFNYRGFYRFGRYRRRRRRYRRRRYSKRYFRR